MAHGVYCELHVSFNILQCEGPERDLMNQSGSIRPERGFHLKLDTWTASRLQYTRLQRLVNLTYFDTSFTRFLTTSQSHLLTKVGPKPKDKAGPK